jgi:hypothetical protein
MPLHIGTIVVGGFSPEKETVVEELGGQHSSSTADPTFSFEQGKARCTLILLTRAIYIVHLHIGVKWKCICIRMFTIPYYPCYTLL